MKKTLVVHPFLLAVFPIAFLFVRNVELLSVSQVVLPTAVALGFVAVSMLILSMVVRDGRQAGIIVSAFVVLFFSYGHVFSLIAPWVEGWLAGDLHHGWVLGIYALLFAGYVYVTFRSQHLDEWTSALNVIAVCLVALALIRYGLYQRRTESAHRSPRAAETEYATANAASQREEDPPDIYYIILDRYGSSRTLRERFQFDNGEFTDHLSSKGFCIASASRANYPKTYQSLASSLNMEHLTYLTDELGRDSSDPAFVYDMVENYRVWRILKSRGYEFLHFGSWYNPTYRNRYADASFVLYPHRFAWTVYGTTILDPIGAKLKVFDYRRMHGRAILRKFDELAEVPAREGPTFVFAHFLLPHPPYLFDAEGEMPSVDQIEARSDKENYLNQLAFTNAMVTRLLDDILSKSDPLPIIVLQADEGPCETLPEFGEGCADNEDWEQLDLSTLRAHMEILNAYYLPGADCEDLVYPSITPVNSFRVIFDHYFGTDYGLVADTSYMFEDLRHPYSYVDVTDRLDYE